MILRRAAAVVIVGLLVGAFSHAAGQQEKDVERTTTLPDSLKGTLSTKVDEGKIRRNWGKLTKGMTFQQVEHLFGNPTRRASDMHDTSTTWYYGVRAIVFDSIKGTVRFWSVN